MRLSREPDEIIGRHEMLRWFLIPPTGALAIYLHKHQGNDPRTHHDHPSDNVTILLAGELVEYRPKTRDELPAEQLGAVIAVSNPEWTRLVLMTDAGAIFERGDFVSRVRFRRAEDPHRLELIDGRPAWTIWIRFRHRRDWGYFERLGWRPRVKHSKPGSRLNE